MTLHNDKGKIKEAITLVNIYTPNIGALKICEANLDGHKGRDQQKCSPSWGF